MGEGNYMHWYWGLGNRYALAGASIIAWLNGAATLLAMNTHHPAGIFALGTIFSLLVFLGSYLANLNYGNSKQDTSTASGVEYRIAVKFHIITYVACGLSLLCFLVGALTYG